MISIAPAMGLRTLQQSGLDFLGRAGEGRMERGGRTSGMVELEISLHDKDAALSHSVRPLLRVSS